MSGLSALPTAELEHALARLGSGQLSGPVTVERLASIGLRWNGEIAAPLIGLDPAAARRVIEVALAERRRPRPRVELVWTGPESRLSEARDTAVVVRELFAAAEHSVIVAGFRFDHGAEILAPLHEAMAKRGVRAALFIDVPWGDGDGAARARAAAGEFLRANWPFGDPRPTLHVDRRVIDGERVTLHAKCVVVDDRRALVTSANFTAAGHSRNVEVGALIEDADFASALAAQWRRAAGRDFAAVEPEPRR